jgi:hypothetical protein
MTNSVCPNCYEGQLKELDPKRSTVHIGSITQCPECQARYVIEDYEVKLKRLSRWDDNEKITTVTIDL